MAFGVSAEIVGFKELVKEFDDLGESFQRSTLRTALRGAIRPVVKRAKAQVEVDEGFLKKAIIGKVRVFRNGEGVARLIVRREAKFRGRGSIAHIVEFGSSQHAARPFVRPAFDATEADGSIIGSFIMAINRTIERKLAKAGVVLNKEEDVE